MSIVYSNVVFKSRFLKRKNAEVCISKEREKKRRKDEHLTAVIIQ